VSSRAQAARGYRLKPAPRARSRGGASRIQWDRVGRIALVLVLVAICISYVSPAINFLDAWRDSKAEHASLAELRAENTKLKQRLTNLDGPDAAERGARKIGMVDEGDGEAAYVVRGLNN
jgi:cell division protein FtsB